MKIVADVRERDSGLPAQLERAGVEVELRPLHVGDYLVAAEIGVERKTVLDLHRSIATRRLWRQLLAMRQTLDRSFLLVDGHDLRGQLSPGGVRGALLEIGDRGVTVIRAVSREDSALWLMRLAARAQRNRPAPRHSGTRPAPAHTPVSLLASMPGISPALAVLLLRRFGSIERVAGASIAELRAVQGIEPRRAQSLRTLLGESWRFSAEPESA